MDGTFLIDSLPDDIDALKRMLVAREAQLSHRDQVIAEHHNTITAHQSVITTYQSTIATQQSTITALTQQRDEYYLEKLRLEVRLAKALKQAYGPRADRVAEVGQLLLDFVERLDAVPAASDDPATEDPSADATDAADGAPSRPASRRLRTRGRRDLGAMDHLPLIEQTYELTDELCRCPNCQADRNKIGTAISYTVEYLPGSLVRIRHVQHKYACRHCEQDGHNPNIELAAKTNGSPIDKGMPGPGLLAYVATSKFADFLPLHRLQNIFARQGFELDRSTMCVWMADVARLIRPVHDRMPQRVRQSHVLATDDTIMPMQHPGKTKKARMWVYQGDDSHPYNVFDFTAGRGRDGPARFLTNFRGTLLADAYGGYDGIVLVQELLRAGCWAHARRKFVDCQAAAPQVTQEFLRLIKELFKLEAHLKNAEPDERLRRRQAEAVPLLASLHALLVQQKASLLPKHPLAEAVGYALNQWPELTLFATDPAVPIHNNLAEQEMKRIALLRKNALFVATPAGGQTAAILSSFTSTCRRHDINPQAYLTQLLTNLPDTPISDLDHWLPDEWKRRQPTPPAEPGPNQT